MKALTLILLASICLGCGSEQTEPEALVCNGSELLCDRSYDSVAFATSHNGMSNQDEDWVAPNHRHGIERQLTDGVRALMLDVHYWDDQVLLCHRWCEVQGSSIGQRPLVDALGAIGTFLQDNPGEVISIIFESYVSAEQLAAVFDEAALVPLLHEQPLDAAWPKLGQMVESGRRLVVFSDEQPGEPAWHHDLWEHAFETDWDVQAEEDFYCDKRRGSEDHALFILNHFVTDPFASEQAAASVNAQDFLFERATSCWDHWGRIPNFVTVDFYSIGDLIQVVAELNAREI